MEVGYTFSTLMVDMSSSVASFLLLCIGIFEVISWIFDPMQIHIPLNDVTMLLISRVTAACINGGIPIGLSFALFFRWCRIACCLLPLFILNTYMYMKYLFWLIPCIVEMIIGIQPLIVEHILPSSCNLLLHVDIYTLIFPLPFVALLISIYAFIGMKLSIIDMKYYSSFSIFSTVPPLVFLLNSENPESETGAVVVASLIFGSNICIYTYIMNNMNTTRNGRQKSY